MAVFQPRPTPEYKVDILCEIHCTKGLLPDQIRSSSGHSIGNSSLLDYASSQIWGNQRRFFNQDPQPGMKLTLSLKYNKQLKGLLPNQIWIKQNPV
jgi:hypothetical protein